MEGEKRGVRWKKRVMYYRGRSDEKKAKKRKLAKRGVQWR